MIEWETKRGEFQRQFKPLIAAIKGSAVNPIILECTLPCEELVKIAVNQMESGSYIYTLIPEINVWLK